MKAETRNSVLDIVVAIAVSLAAGIAINYGRYLGVDGGIVTVATLAILTGLLFAWKPERPDFSRKTFIAAIAAGAFMAALWLLLIGRRQSAVTISVSNWIDFPIAALNLSIVVPLYEEKVVRGVLLKGIARISRGWIAVIVTSVAFALPHEHNMLIALLAGMGLGYLAFYRNIDTYLRAALHGAYNLTLFFWYVFTSPGWAN